MNRIALLAAVAASAVGMVAAGTQAAVLYGTVGGTYSQNFDTLGSTNTNTSLGDSPLGWIDDTASPGAGQFSILGWYLDHRTTATEGGANGHQRVRNGSGNSATGSFYSFGVNSNSDRALGDLGSATLATNGDSVRIGLRLTNNTGETLTSFTVTYDGEQYRDDGGAVAAETMSFSYMTTGTTAANWHTATLVNPATFVNALTFTAPVNGGSGAAVLGNGVGKVAGITATVPVSWAPGTDIWLRWSDIQVAGNDDALAIDNVSFSAVPEPTGLAALAIGSLGFLGRRRNK